MSELSSISSSSVNNKSTLLHHQLISILISLSNFIISHPIYFLYFIFFSPYIFKVLSFLSPLFITTSILILALITTFVKMDSAEPSLNFFVIVYHRLIDSLHSTIEDEIRVEDLEAYKIVFEASIFEIGENPDEFLKVEDKEICFTTFGDEIDRCSSSDSFGTVLDDELEEYRFEITEPEIKKLECLLQVNEESVCVNGGLEEVKMIVNKVNDEIPQRVRASVRSTDSSELDYSDYYNSANNSPNHANFGNFGSMRKEKEWRRTLACKLFEERHNHNINVNGNEAMDSLWETYEPDNSLQQSKSKSESKSKSATKKNKSSKWNNKDLYDHDRVDDENEDEDEEIYDEGPFCCLHALKFSAGKMNLGMKRPNLVKISKALKGIGWLHHVSRHGKKVYP